MLVIANLNKIWNNLSRGDVYEKYSQKVYYIRSSRYNIEKIGNAEITKEISTIGTTLNFSAVLFKPGDKISFNIDVENTSVLSAELYALTLTGLNDIDGENINYTILPVDNSIIHSDEVEGSILKSGGKQTFNITLSYDGTSSNEYHLNLGSTIIYKQK